MTSKGGLQPRMFSQFLIDPTGFCLAQGTSRSTHYHVRMDENKFSADGLQMLTQFVLCVSDNDLFKTVLNSLLS